MAVSGTVSIADVTNDDGRSFVVLIDGKHTDYCTRTSIHGATSAMGVIKDGEALANVSAESVVATVATPFVQLWRICLQSPLLRP